MYHAIPKSTIYFECPLARCPFFRNWSRKFVIECSPRIHCKNAALSPDTWILKYVRKPNLLPLPLSPRVYQKCPLTSDIAWLKGLKCLLTSSSRCSTAIRNLWSAWSVTLRTCWNAFYLFLIVILKINKHFFLKTTGAIIHNRVQKVIHTHTNEKTHLNTTCLKTKSAKRA